MQRLEVLHGLLRSHQLGGEGLRGLFILLRLRLITLAASIIGEDQRLPR